MAGGQPHKVLWGKLKQGRQKSQIREGVERGPNSPKKSTEKSF